LSGGLLPAVAGVRELLLMAAVDRGLLLASAADRHR
jgi:hypothetical protein